MEPTQQATQNSLPSREYRHYKGEGGAEGPEGKGASRLLNRGEHQPRLPRRATPSWRHPLPPPLPVTLRKEECNCSGPSEQEGVHLTTFFTPPTESQTLLVSLPHPTPTTLLPPRGHRGPNFPAPSKSPFPKAEVPLPFRRQVRGGVGRRSPLQRWGSRSAGRRGVRRRGPGDSPLPPPPPPEPQRAAQPKLCDKGRGGGGGSEGTTGVEEAPSELGLS